jgi:hypothetical protein
MAKGKDMEMVKLGMSASAIQAFIMLSADKPEVWSNKKMISSSL